MFLSVVFIIVGIFAVICTIFKPSFYWKSRKAIRLRRLIGDKATTILYIFIGILIIFLGVANLTGMITL
ncbi:hypothetical protein KQI41_09370 [Tissierella pigra]|uniref:hypothetical protein n=1 Tax=Tissierella pigra TaxID=2607614 RepID=UPI001C0F44C7|nr:hypothetical protein [Tissierella pigra]MBU5426613.1 hypothetical protein [Tissierella pigra]